MTSHSPHPSEKSPRAESHPFQWPSPTRSTEISLKEILEKFSSDHDMLKHVLMAKAEEDKKQSAEDVLKAERARIQLKKLDLELIREQARLQYASYSTSAHPAPPPPPPPLSHHPHPSHPRPQPQQHLTRFQTVQSDGRNHPYLNPGNASHHHHLHHTQQQQQQVASPVSYPHSAHPLCQDQSARSLPQLPEEHRKRQHHSTSSDDEQQPSRKKVMEALKAKIQRSGHGNTGNAGNSTTTPTPTSTSTSSTSSSSFILRPAENAPEPPHATQLPKILPHRDHSPSTPSPRLTGKPTLPPIDTNLGRIRPSISSHRPSISTSSPSDNQSPPASPSTDARKETIVRAEA